MKIATLFLVPTILWAQGQASEPPEDWKHGLVFGLTLTQVSYSNWAQGGENSLSYATSLEGKSTLDRQTVNWTNEYKFAFGQARLGAQGLRKTDDKIDLSSVFTYKLGGYIDPYAAATFKTQFARGYTYDPAGAYTAISAFLDPAFLTQSIGAGYQASKEVKTRFGVALREVITEQFNLYADDPKTPTIEKTKIDGGLESVTNVDWVVMEDVQLTSQLELFAAFKKLDDVVVRSNTTLAAKVNKYVSAIFNVQLINERQITPRTQIKESLALGLSYTLL